MRHLRLAILVVLVWSCGASGFQSVTLRAFGDVSFGRSVGQEILAGRIDFPFDSAASLLRADLVFVNLESQLTDQHGETQHPTDRLIFCGPPQAAQSLKRAGITIVSTANNHAFDYGLKGLLETIALLNEAGIAFVGTQADSAGPIRPLIVEKNGIRLGFVAYTEFVNVKGNWRGRISLFDTRTAREQIRQLRAEGANIVIASYHGGAEYVDESPQRTRQQMRLLIDAGADIVLGHHPHVPQGIERYKGGLLFLSLGNFVFYQPQRYWTQRSIGAELTFMRDDTGVRLIRARLLPLRVGQQPSPLHDANERQELLRRIRSLSNVSILEEEGWFSVDLSTPTDWK